LWNKAPKINGKHFVTHIVHNQTGKYGMKGQMGDSISTFLQIEAAVAHCHDIWLGLFKTDYKFYKYLL